MTLRNKDFFYLTGIFIISVLFSNSIFSATTHKGVVGEDGKEIEVKTVPDAISSLVSVSGATKKGDK